MYLLVAVCAFVCVSCADVECDVHFFLGETPQDVIDAQELTHQFRSYCTNEYKGYHCMVELVRQTYGSEHTYRMCAIHERSNDSHQLCRENTCGRVSENVWRCCCDTNKCNNEALAMKLRDEYYLPDIGTIQTTTTSKILTVSTSSVVQSADHNATSPRIECIDGSWTTDGKPDITESVCSSQSWCLIQKVTSGEVKQSCDIDVQCSSQESGCERNTNGIVCCCNESYCNTLCLLDSGTLNVNCTESSAFVPSNPTWPLFLIVAALMCCVIVIVVLLIVRGKIIRRRRRDKNKPDQLRTLMIQQFLGPPKHAKPYEQRVSAKVSKPSDKYGIIDEQKKKGDVTYESYDTPKPTTVAGTYVYPSAM